MAGNHDSLDPQEGSTRKDREEPRGLFESTLLKIATIDPTKSSWTFRTGALKWLDNNPS